MFDGPIRDHARWTPRALAVLTPERAISYGRFDADIDRFAAAVTALGVTPDRGVVALAIQAPYLQMLALAALARLGVTSSPGNDPAADLRLTDRPGLSDPGVIVLDPAWTAAMFAAEPRPPPALEPDPQAVVRVILSSGTTAQPRRVPFTAARIAADSLAALRVYGAGRTGLWIPLTGVGSLLGFSMTVLAWRQGATVADGEPRPIPWLESQETGLIGLTPTKLRDLLAALPGDFRPRSGWRLVVAGAALPQPLALQAALRLTLDIRRQYGATESAQIAAGRPDPEPEVPGLVGFTPADAVAEVVDDADRPLPDGQSGQIRVRGARTAPGYLDDPEATARRFRGGWFYTGDLGRRLPDGQLVVEGRLDERMNLGGRKFMPEVLEAAAFDCPGVRDCAAFAAPDGDGVDQCWLAVSVPDGFDRDTLAPHLARYPGLPPPRFAWVEDIPRNAGGKIQRRRLRDALLAALGGGGT